MQRLLWTQRQDIGPLPRTDHAMAFDTDRRRVVLFGGDSLQAKLFNDTWEWDGENWTQMADIGPSPRSLHAIVYDAVRRRAVVFGGNVGSAAIADTWQWDGGNWTEVADTGPPPRTGHAMAFDSNRGRIVLFGGKLADGTVAGDTWEWDGDLWTQQEDTGPSARERHVMAYDSGRSRVVLFGGVNSGGTLGDTWEWDGATWKEVAQFGANPRLASSMVFKGDRVELFAGISSLDVSPPPTLFRDTWEWDGKHWTQRQDMGPSSRWGHAMAFDSSLSRVILFGGLAAFAVREPTLADRLVADTWEHPEEVTLRSMNLFPTVAPGDESGFTIFVNLFLTGPAPVGGEAVTIDSVGQRLSDAFPLTVSIAEGASTGTVSFSERRGTPGFHTIQATLRDVTRTAILEIVT